MIEVLNAVKTTDITSHLNALDMDSQDILMKYLYKGMEQPASYNTGVLLNWHEKVLSFLRIAANETASGSCWSWMYREVYLG